MPSKWLKPRKKSQSLADPVSPKLDAQLIHEADAWMWEDGATISTLLGSGKKTARARSIIYDKWTQMESDPFISAALRLHVTAALAGDPETGDAIYIETRDGFNSNEDKKLVEELQDVISPLLNESAHNVAYNGISFGDAYARIYSNKKSGVHHILTDELVRTPLIQPFEKAGRTVGYVAYSGEKPVDRLTVLQMARMKMPRLTWVPQPNVIEKSYRMALTEDDIDNTPILPAMVGGSILYNAEEPYDDLKKALLGLVGQRWVDSMDEQILTLNMESMSKDQQSKFLESIKKMLLRSKGLAEKAGKEGNPILERIRHIIPVWGEKGMAAMSGITSQRNITVTTDDVMFHAKSLAGSLGTDLSMIGFADLLSGGLGEGGFFRTSAQIAESSGAIKKALAGSSVASFAQQIVDIHTYSKYGYVHTPQERPYKFSFYGTISALENEKQNTRLQAMNAGGMLVASMQQLKEIGFNKKQMEKFLTSQMMLDEDEAKEYASVVDVPSEGGMGGGFGDDPNGFGGSNSDVNPFDAPQAGTPQDNADEEEDA